jgi:hypothetical protein
MQTSMIKSLNEPVSGTAGLESAMVAQLGAFYNQESFQVLGISMYSESANTCVVGTYIDADNDTPTPFLAVNTAGEGVGTATWVITGFRQTMDYGITGLNERAGLFNLAEIPSTSTNWPNAGWVAVGHVWTPSAPTNLSPLIVIVALDGTTTIHSSEILGVNPASAWLVTSFGGTSTRKPAMMCDVVYDSQNDSLVAIGNADDTANPARTYSCWTEMVSAAVAPTFIQNLNYGLSDDVNYPSFLRSCAIQTQDANGTTVANRTIVMSVGFVDNTKNGSWTLYQPNFSNPWGGGNPRFCWIEKGTNIGTEFYSAQGLSAGDTPSYLTLCNRLTADGEDIYFVGGIAPDGIFGYGISGVQTDSTGGGADNIIPSAGSPTDLIFTEIKNMINQFRQNNVGDYNNTDPTSAITDIVAIGKNNGTSGRRTKIYSAGYEENGRNAPTVATALGGDKTYILAISRGMILTSNEVGISGISQLLFLPSATRMKLAVFTQSDVTKISYAEADLDLSGGSSAILDVSVATGHAAYAWFEYLLYDGVDSLIARKLNEMGVRVTIANVEWYKQDILKQGLDVSTDFFNEWGELKIEENRQRDKVAEQFGRKRNPKRQVRTELFDDYADYEDKESQIKAFPDYDPANDGNPFKDDVALEQEVGKTQKAVDDLRRIEDLVDEETNDEAEYDDEADVSDWGEN